MKASEILKELDLNGLKAEDLTEQMLQQLETVLLSRSFDDSIKEKIQILKEYYYYTSAAHQNMQQQSEEVANQITEAK